MDWKENLEKLERNKNWFEAVDLIQKVIAENPNDVEAYIRAIYLLHNILVEEDCPNDKHDYLAFLLKKYFNESYEKFSDNPEYLFFIGKILYIAEWYFGRDDGSGPIEKSLAFEMQKRAFEKEVNNRLYEWAYVFSKDDKKDAFLLSQYLLRDGSKEINYLKTKGFPGKYMIDSIKYCYENYKSIADPLD